MFSFLGGDPFSKSKQVPGRKKRTWKIPRNAAKRKLRARRHRVLACAYQRLGLRLELLRWQKSVSVSSPCLGWTNHNGSSNTNSWQRWQDKQEWWAWRSNKNSTSDDRGVQSTTRICLGVASSHTQSCLVCLVMELYLHVLLECCGTGVNPEVKTLHGTQVSRSVGVKELVGDWHILLYQVEPGTRQGGSFEKETWHIGIHGELEKVSLNEMNCMKNELTWVNWNKGLGMKELKRMNWHE